MVLNQHHLAIKRLKSIIDNLKKQSLHTDKLNSQSKARKYLKSQPIFSNNLFRTQSNKLIQYVQEIEKNIDELHKQLTYKHVDIIESLLVTIEQQISGLSNAIAANDALHKNIERTVKSRYLAKNQYQKIAKTNTQPTHELYEKLSEHNEYERRLVLMIAEREGLRGKSKDDENNQLKREILALHQRLARCRQAISVIEHDINLAKETP